MKRHFLVETFFVARYETVNGAQELFKNTVIELLNVVIAQCNRTRPDHVVVAGAG